VASDRDGLDEQPTAMTGTMRTLGTFGTGSIFVDTCHGFGPVSQLNCLGSTGGTSHLSPLCLGVLACLEKPMKISNLLNTSFASVIGLAAFVAVACGDDGQPSDDSSSPNGTTGNGDDRGADSDGGTTGASAPDDDDTTGDGNDDTTETGPLGDSDSGDSDSGGGDSGSGTGGTDGSGGTGSGSESGIAACDSRAGLGLPAEAIVVSTFDEGPPGGLSIFGNNGNIDPGLAGLTNADFEFVAEDGNTCPGSLSLAIPFSIYQLTFDGSMFANIGFPASEDWTGTSSLHVLARLESASGDFSFGGFVQAGINGSTFSTLFQGGLRGFGDFAAGEYVELIVDLTAAPPTSLVDVIQVNLQVGILQGVDDNNGGVAPPANAPATPSTITLHIDDIWREPVVVQ